jgi:hypothetical protein
VTGRSAPRALGIVAVALALTVPITVVSADAAPAGVPPPDQAQEQCAGFAALQEAFAAVGTIPTTPKTFAAIHKAARVFRRVARQAPDAIADEMQLLAASITSLDRKLAPLASDIHTTRNRKNFEGMIEAVQRAFTSWTESQDVEALGAAQAAVDEWLLSTCGFRLAAEDATTGGTTASCDSAEATAQTVIAAWKAGDRPTAAACGADAAVTELFSLPSGIEMTFQGCEGIDSTNAECSYSYEGGFMTMTVTKSADGWKVTQVTGHPD